MTIPIYALMRSNRFMDQGLPQKPIPSAAAIFHRAHPSVHFIYLCHLYVMYPISCFAAVVLFPLIFLFFQWSPTDETKTYTIELT